MLRGWPITLYGLLSPARRVEFHLLICVYKVLKNICPSYLLGSYKYTTDVTNHHGRKPNRLYIQSINTNYGKFSFYYRGAIVWNRLPSELNCSSLQSFKSLYKNTCSWFYFCFYCFFCFYSLLQFACFIIYFPCFGCCWRTALSWADATFLFQHKKKT